MKKLSFEEINATKPTRSLLTVIERTTDRFTFLCKCDCGSIIECKRSRFQTGTVLSCGCLEQRRGMTIDEINSIRHPESCLIAIRFDGYEGLPGGRRNKMIVAKCNCGNILRVIAQGFLSGRKFNCYCNRPKPGKPYKKGKRTDVPIEIYWCYQNMIGRCYNPKHSSYRGYGLVGVRVCDEWIKGYESFVKWSLENGWGKGLQLDKDIKGDGLLYSPDNCCFVSRLENNKYKKRGSYKSYLWKSKERTLKEICRLENAIYPTIERRIRVMGLTLHEALIYKHKK